MLSLLSFFFTAPLDFWLQLSYLQPSELQSSLDLGLSYHLECAGAIGWPKNACVMAKWNFRLPNFLDNTFRVNGFFAFVAIFSAVQV
jgi:hypothetical protein